MLEAALTERRMVMDTSPTHVHELVLMVDAEGWSLVSATLRWLSPMGAAFSSTIVGIVLFAAGASTTN